ncbi:MAG: hypothetical protein R3B70_10320 [Polyangiaceae bacterium]
MDPLAPIAGLTIDRYAELSAEVAAARGDSLKVGEVLEKAGLPSDDWQRAHAGWSARLADPVLGLPLGARFEERYHEKLDDLLGPPPDVPPEDFAAMLGEALALGLPGMGETRGVSPLVWSRISYNSRKILATDPTRLTACLALASQISERRLTGEAPPTEPVAPGPLKDRVFEQDATVAAKAVGKAFFSGLDAFGSAMDQMSKSLLGPSVGSRVIVQWSDGNKYPGTVAKLEEGRVLVTMSDGAQRWIPEAFVQVA